MAATLKGSVTNAQPMHGNSPNDLNSPWYLVDCMFVVCLAYSWLTGRKLQVKYLLGSGVNDWLVNRRSKFTAGVEPSWL